jgi:pilus assembly protein FimV
LNTLLSLAKTYISMDDIESARSSLNEVIEFGSKSQKKEAQRILDEIKDR